MAFPPGFLDQLRSRLSIVEVVGRRVKLAKRGRNHLGLCPFHNEKTPSFNVSEDRGGYKCFGCGAAGDMFTFVMRTENLSFPEAVEKLAGEAGVEVPRMDPAERERAQRSKGLAEVLEAAAQYFAAQLETTAGAKARAYIERRGLLPDTVTRFRLGYSPASRVALKDAMLARGFTEAVLLEAGLLGKPDDGGPSYDRFRDRLMYPIADRRGRVIAFGARALGDVQPKYLNSPETPVFHKGRTLYNLAMAREAAGAVGTVVVAEGYMDVIALAQAGIAHAVAPLGTALTEEQMAELWRLAAEPILCFDGDRAGYAAALKAADRALPLLEPGRSFRFALLPAGQDPDDLIRAQGAPAMQGILDGAIPLADLLWRREAEGRALDTPERRAGLKKALTDLAQGIQHPSIRELYLAEFRQRLDDFFAAQRARPPQSGFQRGAGGNRRWPDTRGPGNPMANQLALQKAVGSMVRGGTSRAAQIVLGIITHPWLLERHFDEIEGMVFDHPDLDSLKTATINVFAATGRLDATGLESHLSDCGQRGLIEKVRDLAGKVPKAFLLPGDDHMKVEAEWVEAVIRPRLEALRVERAALAQRMHTADVADVIRQKQALDAEERALTERARQAVSRD